MAKRCEEVASRKHQIIFLPNEKDYVGAHGDVGLLARAARNLSSFYFAFCAPVCASAHA